MSKSQQKKDTLPTKDDGKTDWSEVIKMAKASGNGDLGAFVFGKELPKAIEFEEAVLGACLVDSTGYVAAASVFMSQNPFYLAKNQEVKKKICRRRATLTNKNKI